MAESIKESCKLGVAAYAAQAREQWVLEWPGQVVLAVSAIFWTSAVTNALKLGVPGLRHVSHASYMSYMPVAKDEFVFESKDGHWEHLALLVCNTGISTAPMLVNAQKTAAITTLSVHTGKWLSHDKKLKDNRFLQSLVYRTNCACQKMSRSMHDAPNLTCCSAKRRGQQSRSKSFLKKEQKKTGRITCRWSESCS